MKFLYEVNGEQYIIVTKRDDHDLGEMFNFFIRLMLSAGFDPKVILEIFPIKDNNNEGL